jgi:hypothetical protein
MSILTGTLAFAAMDNTGYIAVDSIGHSRREVVDYIKKWEMHERFKPVKVMIIPVDFGQT